MEDAARANPGVLAGLGVALAGSLGFLVLALRHNPTAEEFPSRDEFR